MPFTPEEQIVHDQIHEHETNKDRLEELRKDIEHPDLLILVNQKLAALENEAEQIAQRVHDKEEAIVAAGGDAGMVSKGLEAAGELGEVLARVRGELEEVAKDESVELIIPEQKEERKIGRAHV